MAGSNSIPACNAPFEESQATDKMLRDHSKHADADFAESTAPWRERYLRGWRFGIVTGGKLR